MSETFYYINPLIYLDQSVKTTDSPTFVRGTFSEATLSPFAITSTVVNTNLNADLLDGQHGSYYQVAGSYQPLATNLTSLSGLTFASTSFVKMSAAGTFALDTDTYSLSSHNHSGTYEVPLTFSTGLTRTTNTITVNTSQNITTLSNLTSNGFVKTSGGDGTLSVDTGSYQPLHANLTSIAGMATTVGLVKQTSANVFGIDATAYHSGVLTATRVPYASSAAVLTDSANMTFDGTSLTAGGLITTGLVKLPTTTSTVGQIQWNSVLVMHTFVPSNQAPTFNNVFIGTNSGNNFAGMTNAANAYEATGNYSLGYNNLMHLTTGFYNLCLGVNSGHKITTGNSNVCLGTYAGENLTTGYGNFLLGREGGEAVSSGANNVSIGNYAFAEGNGDTNVMIGAYSGKKATGSNNIFLGYFCGHYETGSAKFIVDIVPEWTRVNEAGTRLGALLYGVMNATKASQYLRINGNVGILTATDVAPSCALDVVGAISNTTTINAGTGFKCGGTAAAADGTYALPTSITIKGGIITAIS